MTTARRTTTKNRIYILVNILFVEPVKLSLVDSKRINASCFLFPKRISANCDSDVNGTRRFCSVYWRIF